MLDSDSDREVRYTNGNQHMGHTMTHSEFIETFAAQLTGDNESQQQSMLYAFIVHPCSLHVERFAFDRSNLSETSYFIQQFCDKFDICEQDAAKQMGIDIDIVSGQKIIPMLIAVNH